MGTFKINDSLIILHIVNMIRLLVSFGVLFVLLVVTKAASTKYRHSSYDDSYDDHYKKYDHVYGKKHVAYAKSYKHEPEYYGEYEEPSYEVYEEYDLKNTYTHKYEPTYRHKRSVYGYGGDSYGKSYSTYSYKPSSYRHM